MKAKTYENDDALNRKEFGDLLYGLMRSEFILADESFVVALTGGFGSGKSHFLEMWENEILAEPDGPSVVHINAWDSDHSGEPVLAIVSAIAIQIEKAKSKPKKAIATLKSAAARVARGGASLAKDMTIGYLETKTGVELKNTWEAIKEDQIKDLLGKSAASIFENHEARKQAIIDLKESLTSLVADSDDLKIILVVDELDRCRPNYAIDFLESLKHLFNVRGLAVLLAVDWDQLSCTAEALFGTNLNTTEYFRKFVTRKVPLPALGMHELNKLIRKLWERLIASEELVKRKRFTHAPHIGNIGNIPATIILGSGITRPRQVEEIFRILSHYLYTNLDKSGLMGEETFILVLMLLSINTISTRTFDSIAEGSASVDLCLDSVFNVTRPKDKALEWDSAYLEGVFIDSFVNQNSAVEFKSKFLKTLTQKELGYRTSIRSGMPHFSNLSPKSQMQNLATKLMSLKRFSSS